jgi:nucleotide-binding universal stress UspA family protein
VPATHMIASYIPDTAEMSAAALQFAEEEAGEYLREVVAGAPSLSGSVRAEVVTAHQPAFGILRTAEQAQAGIIVIGSRGHGGAARLVLGSVADKVVRGAHVPVLVCPEHGSGRHASLRRR